MTDEKTSQVQNSAPERTGRPGATRLGPTVVIKGDIEAHEDLLIEGRLEGNITLPSGTLTVAKGARVEGEIKVRALVLHGELAGNVDAGERVQIFDTARMDGDVATPKITVADGARFTGGIRTGAKS
jgi:cytoskeletal protein CcmA (bactofilin family)